MEELWEDYLQYLIWLCHLEGDLDYGNLFEFLHNTEFIWLIERDENRAGDGMRLRDHYKIPLELVGEDDFLVEEFMNRPCSVFEMMVALAIRMDDEFLGNPADPQPDEFFWNMIENLGLVGFSNKRFNRTNVSKRVKMWLDRRFTKYGLGSPFPVYDDDRDQRNLEIWDQMISYISEKYG